MRAANLVPNSSFECGPGRGWAALPGNSSFGNPAAIAGELRAGGAFHGGYSMRLNSRLLSRPIYLEAGSYVLTVHMKATPAAAVFLKLLASSQAGALLSSPGIGASFVGVTTNWGRFTNVITAPTNGVYLVKIYTVQGGTSDIRVDAVQVEAGTVATPYAPQASMEMALDTADPNNLLLLGDAKEYRGRFWNDGSDAIATGQVLIYDQLNRLVGSNSVSEFVPAHTNKTVLYPLPPKNGYLRLASRLYINRSEDETSVAVLPYAEDLTPNPNGFLGTHPPYGPYHIKRERRSGFTFARDLSPAATMRWGVIEPTKGNFIWNDLSAGNLATNGMIAYCSLTPSNGSASGGWPPWAILPDGSPDWGAYLNYIYRTVSRYSKPPFNIHYWEAWNEKNSSVWNVPPIFVSPTNLVLMAQLETWSADMIRAADPDAYIVALGGMANAAQARAVWDLIPPETQKKINGVSCHIYPQDPDGNPNVAEYDVHYVSNKDWYYAFKDIRPVINSESGQWTISAYTGWNSLHEFNYTLSGTWTPEELRSEKQARTQYGLDRHLYSAFRSLGYGFRYINYWSKAMDETVLDASSTGPTVIEYNGAEKPNGVALLMANVFQGRGLGRITNSVNPCMDAFGFTNRLGSVVCAWNFDRKFTTITLAHDHGVGLVDVMGNQVCTNSAAIPIGRTPAYLVSDFLSINQLSNLVKQASVTPLADTTGPAISINIAPSGLWDGATNAALFKWTAMDENKINWRDPASSTNVVSQWALDDGAYTDLSASNHVFISNIPVGNHKFSVRAQDSLGNATKVEYVFDPTL